MLQITLRPKVLRGDDFYGIQMLAIISGWVPWAHQSTKVKRETPRRHWQLVERTVIADEMFRVLFCFPIVILAIFLQFHVGVKDQNPATSLESTEWRFLQRRSMEKLFILIQDSCPMHNIILHHFSVVQNRVDFHDSRWSPLMRSSSSAATRRGDGGTWWRRVWTMKTSPAD